MLDELFTPKVQPLVGVDISTSAIKMLEIVEPTRRQYRVERYVIEPLPKDSVLDGGIANIDVVGDILKKAWKRMGTTTKNVAMALPSASVITKKIVVPVGLREEELEVQVESEANQYIPFSLDEVNLDFQRLGPSATSPEEEQVIIAASRKEKVEDRVAVAQIAGLKASVIDVESYVAQKAFELIEKQLPGQGIDQSVALVDIGSSMMHVTMLRNGEMIYNREQPFGGNVLTQKIQGAYGMPYEEAEYVKCNGGLPDDYEKEILEPFISELSQEIIRAMQFFFTATAFNKIDFIVLMGGCATIPGLDDFVATRTQVGTLVANPFVNMSMAGRISPKQLAMDAPSLMIACGLALRRFGS